MPIVWKLIIEKKSIVGVCIPDQTFFHISAESCGRKSQSQDLHHCEVSHQDFSTVCGGHALVDGRKRSPSLLYQCEHQGLNAWRCVMPGCTMQTVSPHSENTSTLTPLQKTVVSELFDQPLCSLKAALALQSVFSLTSECFLESTSCWQRCVWCTSK